MRYVVLVSGLTMGWRYCYGETARLALDMGIWKEVGWVVGAGEEWELGRIRDESSINVRESERRKNSVDGAC